MRGRRLIAVVVVCLAVAGCTSTDGSDGAATETGPSTTVLHQPISVPAGLGTHAVAASDDWVVGVLKVP
ncbi:MAG TPA: hypothetical protein VFN21_06610, partial [Acidimicrobiales bacterium]|nr:hypothetical protein [Acidimicrobiales bacterium]